VFTFLFASFPRLARLFYLCMCLPLPCFSLVLFLLLFVVGFELSLTSFWGCLSLVLCALVCFIRSFKPYWLGRLFTYPLAELLEIR